MSFHTGPRQREAARLRGKAVGPARPPPCAEALHWTSALRTYPGSTQCHSLRDVPHLSAPLDLTQMTCGLICKKEDYPAVESALLCSPSCLSRHTQNLLSLYKLPPRPCQCKGTSSRLLCMRYLGSKCSTSKGGPLLVCLSVDLPRTRGLW